MVKIRAYQPGDAVQICNMLSRYTKYQRDEAFWLWINRILPDQSSIISVAEVDGEIVGHYAILPMELSIGSKSYKAGLGIHAFITPPARTLVPIFMVSKYCYRLAKEAGLQFIWGFPNSNYRVIQVKVEKWHCVDTFNALEKDISTVAAGPDGYALKEVDPLNPVDMLQLSELLEQSSRNASVQVEATINKWLRRYTMHPQSQYQIMLLSERDNIIGVVVTKCYQDVSNATILGHIMDYRLKETCDLEKMITATEQHFKSLGVGRAVLWPFNVELREVLTQKGYQSSGFDTFFGIKLIDRSMESEFQNLRSINNWNLTMGMSDVF